MSMTLQQQQAMVQEMYNLENQLEMASIGHRIAMVIAEAMRSHFCLTPSEVNVIVAKFATEEKEKLREELDLVYENGAFRSVDDQPEMPDPELN